MLNIKESRARELLRYSVENNILEKLGKTRNIKYVKKLNRRKKPSEKTVGKNRRKKLSNDFLMISLLKNY